LPTFPENLMEIGSEVFAQSCQQTDKQTEKQTNNDEKIAPIIMQLGSGVLQTTAVNRRTWLRFWGHSV